jgi:hypothetical protein
MKDKEILQEIYKTIQLIKSRIDKYSNDSNMNFADFAFCAYANQTLINIYQKIPKDSVIHSSSPQLSQKLFTTEGLFLNDARLITAHNLNLFKVYQDNKSAIIQLYRTELADILKATTDIMNEQGVEFPAIALSTNNNIHFDELESMHNYVQSQIGGIFNQDQKLPQNILTCYSYIIVDRYLSVTYPTSIEARAAHRLLQQSVIEILKNCAKNLAISTSKPDESSKFHQELSETLLYHLQKQPVRNEYAHAVSLSELTSRDQSTALLEFELSDPNLKKIFAKKSFSDIIIGFRKSLEPKQALVIKSRVELETLITTENNTEKSNKKKKGYKKKAAQSTQDIDDILGWINSTSIKTKKPKVIQEQEKLKKQPGKAVEQKAVLEKLPEQTAASSVLKIGEMRKISTKLSELVVRIIKLIQTDEVSLAQAYFKKMYMISIQNEQSQVAEGIISICTQIQLEESVADDLQKYYLMDKIIEYNDRNLQKISQLVKEFTEHQGIYFDFLPKVEQIEELASKDLRDRYAAGKEIILKLIKQALFDPEIPIPSILLQDVFFYIQKSSPETQKKNMHATRQIVEIFEPKIVKGEEVIFERGKSSVFEMLNLLPVDIDFLRAIYEKGVNVRNIFYFRTAVKQLVIRGDTEKLEALLEILNLDHSLISFILNCGNVINSQVGQVHYHEIAKIWLPTNRSEQVIKILKKYGENVNVTSPNFDKLVEFQSSIDSNADGCLTVNSIDSRLVDMFTVNDDWNELGLQGVSRDVADCF